MNATHYVLAALVGLLAGIANGSLGIGGGVLLVPMFLMLIGLPMKHAVGTSVACIVTYSLVAGAKHFSHDNIRWRVFALVVPLGMIGSYLGAYLSNKLPAIHLKRALGILLFLVGVKLAFFPQWPRGKEESAAPGPVGQEQQVQATDTSVRSAD